LKVLKAMSSIYNCLLVSAYDVANASANDRPDLLSLLKELKNAGGYTLLDSGNYESFWYKGAKQWTPSAFHGVLHQFPYSFSFGFDSPRMQMSRQQYLHSVLAQWRQDQEAAASNPVLPIVHGSRDDLPEMCRWIAEETKAQVVAVAERDTGEGLIQRATTISRIREELNKADHYVALHLLGTGNPISLAIFSLQGADSFDGLEWCQTIVDYDTGHLHHLSHADFFLHQSKWSGEDVTFQSSVLAHNIQFYSAWIAKLRKAKAEGGLKQFCFDHLSKERYVKLEQGLQW
jgi:queuine/archaeosine tRNA-ribosyltransferase